MSSNVVLPPLVAPNVGPTAEAPRPRAPLTAVVALLALTVTVIAIGWGAMQWSSARDWRHRSDGMEAQFKTLDARAERAERGVIAAQLATARARAQLAHSEARLATLANQQAFASDLKAEFCVARPDLLPPDAQARICR
jgi:hypothetical protein